MSLPARLSDRLGQASAGVLDRLSISEQVVFDAVCGQANTLCGLAESLPNRLPSVPQ